MKRKWLTFIGLAVLAGVVLGACAQPVVDDSQVVALQDQLEDALSDAGASDEEIAALQAALEDAIAAAEEAAAAATAEEAPVGPPTVFYNWSTEPPHSDPALVTDTTSADLVNSIFVGLYDLDDDTQAAVPVLATGAESNEDSTVWTFTMRDDVPWVQYNTTTGEVDPVLDADGNQLFVKAQDIEYGVKRTCDPNTASDYAYIVYIVEGCQAVNTADPGAEDFQELLDGVGVKAIDDTTIEFTLSFPAGFLPQVVTMPQFYPVPEFVISEYGDRWFEPGIIITNGAYVMSEWIHGDHLTLEKNPHWPLWGTDWGSGNVERLFGVMIEEDSTQYAMYLNDELDTSRLPMEEIPSVKADAVLGEQYVQVPSNCTYYYGFRTTKPPMDDPRVRRALSMAIDRLTLVETVTQGGQIPANTFTNPLNFGNAAEDPSIAPWALTEEKGGTGYADAVAQGQALLAEAGFANGAGLDILLMHNVSEGHARIAQAIQAMWQEAYPDMTASVETQEWAVYLDTIRASTDDAQVPHVYRLGWCADYPHANNWVTEVFHPDVGANRTKMSPDDPVVGDLIQQFMDVTEAAQVASDAEALELYAQAEQLLVDDIAAMAPIYYYTTVKITKPWLERTYTTGSLHLFLWNLDADARAAAME
jgi:oligopeptide transport system substrate-binding protein